MVNRAIAWRQLSQPVEQMFEPKHGSYAFVERMLVENQVALPLT
jgi:hypothetical protein